jgi:hypothetical protein
MAYSLGSSGLLTEFCNYETFGTIQARIGQSRAQIELSRIPGAPATGYRDTANVGVLPFDLINTFPGAGDKSFLKLGGVINLRRGDRSATWLDSDTYHVELQYLHVPTPDTLLALGVIKEDCRVDLRHNGGTIRSSGMGLRADVIHKVSPHWGLVARADYLGSESRNRIPLGGGAVYAFEQDSDRIYLQADLVGTATRETLRWVPAGWVFHPSVGTVWQHNSFNDATDSFGGIVGGTVGRSDDYALVAASVTFASTDFRPGRFAPYFEIGLEHEVRNDLNAMLDDPANARMVIGVSVNLGYGARLDIEYGRHDGFKGLRRDQAITVHLGMLF